MNTEPTPILVLSEDSESRGAEVVRQLVLKIVRPIGQGGVELLRVYPGAKERYPAVQANRWRSESHRDHEPVRQLCLAIASRLAEGEIVVFHYDADVVWSKRSECVNRHQFRDKVRCRVEQFLLGSPEKGRQDDGWVQRCMDRLIEFVPHYSIEAWTFHSPQTPRLCKCKGAVCSTRTIVHWHSVRAMLDEVVMPKEQICLKNRHNIELARSFPAREVRALETSFAEVVERFRRTGLSSSLLRL